MLQAAYINDEIRHEFEEFAKCEFDIDCSDMMFEQRDDDKKPQYHGDDEDDAFILSAMLYSYVAGRSHHA